MIRLFCWGLVLLAGVLPARAQVEVDFRVINDLLPDLTQGDAAWADADADGDLDLLLVGIDPDETPVIGLFRNDGDTVVETNAGLAHQTNYTSFFNEGEDPSDLRPVSPLLPLRQAAAAWGDADGDGLLDLAVSGRAGTPLLRLYFGTGDAQVLALPVTLPGLSAGDLAWGDYDNDGDHDLALTGLDEAGQHTTFLYENDGAGGFTRRDAGLTGLAYGSVEWGDYDADGDLDLLVAGNAQPQAFVVKVYRNDGGAFTDAGLAVEALAWPRAAWADYDGDGDLDLAVNGGKLCVFMVCGRTRVYRNDGGTFADLGQDLPGGYFGDLAWGDYDADGDLDLLTMGGTFPGEGRNMQVLRNDGAAFTTVSSSFSGVNEGALEWGDYDGDGDLDVVSLGARVQGPWTQEYRNELGGNAPPSAPTGLRAVRDGEAVVFSWEPASDDHTPAPGLTYNLRVGTLPGGADVLSALALPDGTRRVSAPGNAGHNLTWTLHGLPVGSYFWSVQAVDGSLQGSAFADEQLFSGNPDDTTPPGPPAAVAAVGRDAEVVVTWSAPPDPDVVRYRLYRDTAPGATTFLATVLQGTTRYVDTAVENGTTYYYRLTAEDAAGNESAFSDEASATPTPPFAAVGAGLPGLTNSTAAWGDYDADGDPDLALMGLADEQAPQTRIYRNDGGTLTDVGAPLVPTSSGDLAWGDYDNDGDLDLLVAGSAASQRSARLYRNDGGDTFTSIDAGLAGLFFAAVAWADLDGDGDLDLTLAGETETDVVTRLYRNDGGDTFTLLGRNDLGVDLPGVARGSVDWGDYDADGDPDLLLAGNFGGFIITRIYRNTGGGQLEQLGASLPGLDFGEARWADLDADGDLDLALTGSIAGSPTLHVYRNEAGAFSNLFTGPQGTYSGDVAWGDYDGDGRPDLAVAGGAAVRIFHNEEDTFTPLATTALPGILLGDVAWGDLDGDGAPDLLVTGDTGDTDTGRITEVFRNNLGTAARGTR